MPLPATATNIANVSILSRDLAKQAWYNTFWSKLAGFMTETETNGIKQFNPVPGKVIQVMKNFIEEGRDNMLMPIELMLNEPGVYGDKQLKGTGEVLQLKYLQIFINQWRKAVIKNPGAMSNQRVKLYSLMERAKPALIRWWAHAENQAIFEAMYLGVSPNLSAGTNDDGLGLKCRLHPNWYYQGTSDGTLVTLGTEKYNKTASNMTALSSANVAPMTSNTLLGLVELLTGNLLIKPIVSESVDPFWIMLVHPRTFKRLKKDSTIKSDQNAAYNKELMKHPAISGKQMLYYEGICIIPDPYGVRLLDANAADVPLQLAGGDLRKGWMNPSPYSYEICNSIILGENAMGKGIASPLKFTQMVDDHDNVSEIGSNQIVGYNRSDFFAEGDNEAVYSRNNAAKGVLATGYEALNQSSMILSTED